MRMKRDEFLKIYLLRSEFCSYENVKFKIYSKISFMLFFLDAECNKNSMEEVIEGGNKHVMSFFLLLQMLFLVTSRYNVKKKYLMRKIKKSLKFDVCKRSYLMIEIELLKKKYFHMEKYLLILNLNNKNTQQKCFSHIFNIFFQHFKHFIQSLKNIFI